MNNSINSENLIRTLARKKRQIKEGKKFEIKKKIFSPSRETRENRSSHAYVSVTYQTIEIPKSAVKVLTPRVLVI